MTRDSKAEGVKVGDRVSWMGGINFGRDTARWTGVVVATGCGVPYYFDPPQYTDDGRYQREAGRYPAAMVRVDIPQHGETRINYLSDIVVENSKLSALAEGKNS